MSGSERHEEFSITHDTADFGAVLFIWVLDLEFCNMLQTSRFFLKSMSFSKTSWRVSVMCSVCFRKTKHLKYMFDILKCFALRAL